MQKIKVLLPKLGAGLIALLLTLFLLVTNTPPFTLLEAEEDTAQESEAAAQPVPEQLSTPPASEAGTRALIIVVPDPLDEAIEADLEKGGMKEGANTWVKSLNLINSSRRPLTAYLFVQGLEACSPAVSENCVSFPARVQVGAAESVAVDLEFNQVLLKDDSPADGALILVGAGERTEIPFKITAAWQEEPADLLGILKTVLNWGFTLLVLAVVFTILYFVLYLNVYPILLPERSLPLRMSVTEDTKLLWALFSSRLRELRMMGIGGSLSNPQVPPKKIDLPTNLGKEGDMFKAFLDLLNWILPRRGISIRLQALENKKFGKGLSVALERNNNHEILDERVFWAGNYGIDPKNMDYEDLLMTPVVLWVTDWWERRHPPRRKASRRPAPRTRWDVQAYLLLASRLWSDDLALGIKLYMDALYREPANRQAQAGLGRVWTEYSEHEKLSEYEKRNCLELAIAYLKDVTRKPPGSEDVIWFAALYNLAVAQLYLGDTKSARESSDRLFEQIEKHSGGAGKHRDSSFRTWLGMFESMALFFKYSTSLETDPPKTPQLLRESAKQAVAEIARDAGIEPDLDTFLLVQLDYRSQYNAACYFSRCYRLAKERKWPDRGFYAEVALDYLRMSLGHRGGLVNLAWKDRALEPIRGDRSLKAKFKAIVPELKEPVKKEKKEEIVLRIVMDKPLVIKNEPAKTAGSSKT